MSRRRHNFTPAQRDRLATDRQHKLDQLHERLSAQVEQLRNSHGWRNWLTIASSLSARRRRFSQRLIATLARRYGSTHPLDVIWLAAVQSYDPADDPHTAAPRILYPDASAVYPDLSTASSSTFPHQPPSRNDRHMTDPDAITSARPDPRAAAARDLLAALAGRQGLDLPAPVHLDLADAYNELELANTGTLWDPPNPVSVSASPALFTDLAGQVEALIDSAAALDLDPFRLAAAVRCIRAASETT